MKDGAPFGLAGLWENCKDPASGEWIWTFTIITVPSNELIARIHGPFSHLAHGLQGNG
jgi:putative SOS response-associated peptidase YedK